MQVQDRVHSSLCSVEGGARAQHWARSCGPESLTLGILQLTHQPGATLGQTPRRLMMGAQAAGQLESVAEPLARPGRKEPDKGSSLFSPLGTAACAAPSRL